MSAGRAQAHAEPFQDEAARVRYQSFNHSTLIISQPGAVMLGAVGAPSAIDTTTWHANFFFFNNSALGNAKADALPKAAQHTFGLVHLGLAHSFT